MIIIPNRVVPLLISDIDLYYQFKATTVNNETVDILEFPHDFSDLSDLEPASIILRHTEDYLGFDLSVGGAVPISCDIGYIPNVAGKPIIMLNNLKVTSENVSGDYLEIADPNDVGDVAPLSEEVLQQWISSLRAQDNSLPMLVGYSAITYYGHGNTDGVVAEGYREFLFKTDAERDAALLSTQMVTNGNVLLLNHHDVAAIAPLSTDSLFKRTVRR